MLYVFLGDDKVPHLLQSSHVATDSASDWWSCWFWRWRFPFHDPDHYRKHMSQPPCSVDVRKFSEVLVRACTVVWEWHGEQLWIFSPSWQAAVPPHEMYMPMQVEGSWKLHRRDGCMIKIPVSVWLIPCKSSAVIFLLAWTRYSSMWRDILHKLNLTIMNDEAKNILQKNDVDSSLLVYVKKYL